MSTFICSPRWEPLFTLFKHPSRISYAHTSIYIYLSGLCLCPFLCLCFSLSCLLSKLPSINLSSWFEVCSSPWVWEMPHFFISLNQVKSHSKPLLVRVERISVPIIILGLPSSFLFAKKSGRRDLKMCKQDLASPLLSHSFLTVSVKDPS